jgi:phosphonate transport system permease protein
VTIRAVSAPQPNSLVPPRSLRQRLVTVVITVGFLAVLGYAWHDTGASVAELFHGIGNTFRLIRHSLPPDFSGLGDAIRGALLTFNTGFLATVGGLVISLLLTPLAARNIAPHRVVYEIARLVIGVLRAIPEFVYALVFLVAVGINPYSVVLAITVHTIGVLAKLFAEAVEDMDMGPVDALRASGAGRTQVFLHAIVPAMMASFTALGLYRLDTNVRAALYLGAFGGGGLGFILYTNLSLFQFQKAAADLVVLLVLLLIVERISTLLRARLL